MALPIFDHFIDKGKEEPEYFLALEITETHVKSAAWIVANGRTEVVATGSTSYWQGKDPSELITATDSSLAGLAQKLAGITQKEPSKVILGLPALWVSDDNKILEVKGVFLKDLTKKLELTPMGFVVTPEALVQYLKDQEGIPPSSIFVGLEDEEIEVTLIHLGKVIGRTRVARSVDLGSDLEEGLTRFLPQAILPNRILLFNSHAALEESRQQLLNHPWRSKGTKLPFLHFPKVEILSEEETIKAVAVAGGAEAARAIGLPIQAEQQTLPPKEELDENELTQKEPVVEEAPEKVPNKTPSDFPAIEEPEKFGFLKGQDIGLGLSQAEMPPPNKVEPILAIPKAKPTANLNQVITKFKNVFSFKFPPTSSSRLKVAGIISLCTLTIFLLGFVLWWNFAKATITIEVQAKSILRDVNLQVNPKVTQVDPIKGVLPGNFIQGSANGQQTLSTTGQKLVGTKAKGSVVVFNNTSQEITLKAGSLISSDSGLKFTLDNATSIASPSGTAENPTPGQTTVTVTASDVGPEYNLTGGTNFTVPGYSAFQVVAKNQNVFAGGDKRQVQAVSKEDKDKLATQLTDDLSGKARENLTQNIPQESRIIGGSITFKVTNQTFDKNVGEEAISLTLSENVSAQALAIPKVDLENYLTLVAAGALTDQYVVSLDDSTVDFSDVKVSPDGSIKVAAKIKIVALPKIDKAILAKEISGKSPANADEILSHIPGFIRQEYKLFPELPGFLAVFPEHAEKITIEIKVINISQ